MSHAYRLGGVVFGLLLFAVPTAQAVEDAAVKRAIDRGVGYLQAIQAADGTWPYDEIGATALAGLALLECDVPANSPAIQKAGAAVRQVAPNVTTTYSLALSILFLDRLADPADVPLIQALGVRLLAGQNGTGGWGYICPMVGGAAEIRRLTQIARQRNQLVGRRDLPKLEPGKPRPRPALPKEIQDQLTLINRQAPGPRGPDDILGTGDNSNTQFAVLGLWVARRHGLPVDRAFKHVETRFRRSQNADRGWGYLPTRLLGDSSPTMTCAGLLGLAMAHGAVLEAGGGKNREQAVRAVMTDPAIRGGLQALGTTIGHPMGRRAIAGRAGGKAYYFLWSLERVAVIYGLKTIDKKDWYTWGAEILLASQLADGGWRGEYAHAGVDTCFALLFLKRSNLASDLTAQFKGQVKDPAEVRLKAGGIGGEELVGKKLKPGVEFTPAPPEKEKPPAHVENEKPPARVGPKPPPARVETASEKANRLVTELVRAAPAERAQLIRTMKETRGEAYTEALTKSIHRLTGDDQAQARTALAERLTRMTARTLRGKLHDDDAEVRRAAALACAMKDDRQYIPDLIPVLEDPRTPVVAAAHRALKSLTGKDFGPDDESDRSERARAAEAWQGWWKKNQAAKTQREPATPK